MLRNAISDYIYEYAESLPSEDELAKTHVFSNKFKQLMGKMLIKQSKPAYYMLNTIGKKVAVILITILVAMSTTVLSVKALRTPVFNFFYEIFSDHCEVSFDKDSGIINQNEIEMEIKNEYFPTDIPSEFKVSDGLNYKGHKEYVLENDKGENIVFAQDLIITNVAISADETDIEEVKVNNYDGIYIAGDNEAKINTLVWRNESYSLSLYGNVNKEMLLKLANSTKLKK